MALAACTAERRSLIPDSVPACDTASRATGRCPCPTVSDSATVTPARHRGCSRSGPTIDDGSAGRADGAEDTDERDPARCRAWRPRPTIDSSWSTTTRDPLDVTVGAATIAAGHRAGGSVTEPVATGAFDVGPNRLAGRGRARSGSSMGGRPRRRTPWPGPVDGSVLARSDRAGAGPGRRDRRGRGAGPGLRLRPATRPACRAIPTRPLFTFRDDSLVVVQVFTPGVSHHLGDHHRLERRPTSPRPTATG